MTEMTEFERRVADGMLHRAGPIRPVDDLAVFEAVADRQQRRAFTMFSALKFVTAGVIVALCGSFLLASILTTPQGDEIVPAAVTASATTATEPRDTTLPPESPPSPTTAQELLSGMLIEEVEPGVYRVINDGVRDLANADDTGVVAGLDGSVWLLRPQRFLRLGTEGTHEWPTHLQERPHQLMDVEVGPDGTVWTVQEVKGGGYALLSFDGDDWTRHRDVLDEAGVEVGPDGTVWSAWDVSDLEDAQVVGYLDGDTWQPLGDLRDPDELYISGTGDIWAAAGMNTKNWVHRLFRFTEDGWQDTGRHANSAEVGPQGTVWTIETVGRPWVLSRFDGSEWQEWSLADSPFKPVGVFPDVFEVAPDRGLWVGGSVEAVTDDDQEICGNGVGNFDGLTWFGYLPDLCVTAMDIAPDGSVWLLAADGQDGAGSDLYVITPEAVAATG